MRNFEDFYRNFTGISKDEEWNFKKTACISDNYSIESMIPSLKIPLKIPVVFSTSTPNTGMGAHFFLSARNEELKFKEELPRGESEEVCSREAEDTEGT